MHYPEIELEDLPPDQRVIELKKICIEVGRRAVAEARALNLPLTFVENDQIVKEYPDGSREILGTVPPRLKVVDGKVQYPDAT
jgi:hypothetical protein